MNAMINPAYRIGDTLPAASVRDIVTDRPTAPTWHCLIVRPQAESKTRAYFDAKGMASFYPSQNYTRHMRGKKIQLERPIITQHVYVQFRNWVNWDVLKARRLITGVYCRGNIPVAIPADVIKHLQGLTVEAERLKAARAEMLRVRPGDQARIISGPLAGIIVDVGEITGKEAWLTSFGGRVKADINSLERIQDVG